MNQPNNSVKSSSSSKLLLPMQTALTGFTEQKCVDTD